MWAGLIFKRWMTKWNQKLILPIFKNNTQSLQYISYNFITKLLILILFSESLWLIWLCLSQFILSIDCESQWCFWWIWLPFYNLHTHTYACTLIMYVEGNVWKQEWENEREQTGKSRE